MKSLVKISLLSVSGKLNYGRFNYCMEIFGYDFIIDENFKAWLIEVNTNPCLEESSNLLKMILPRMLDDALKLTVDIVFPKRKRNNPDTYASKPYSVTGYSDSENLWDFLIQL